MEWQLNALSNLGLLSRFVGMVTDSRSFMSYPRHEYFRRVLCNLIGRDVENGEFPNDETLLGPMIRNICYANAENYMAFPGVSDAETKTRQSGAAEIELAARSRIRNSAATIAVEPARHDICLQTIRQFGRW